MKSQGSIHVLGGWIQRVEMEELLCRSAVEINVEVVALTVDVLDRHELLIKHGFRDKIASPLF